MRSGREMVKRMEAKGIIVDVAHASDQVRARQQAAASVCVHGVGPASDT